MLLEPQQEIIGIKDSTITNFWQWAYSDILSNRNRSIFAEYLVAKALNLDNTARIEWDSKDLSYKGINIEVKSSAYAQSWGQNKESKISFDIEKKKCWNQENNTYSSDKQRNSDFFIFCLYFKFSKKIIDVIDVSNWHFYILSKEIIDSEYGNQKRVVLNKLKELTDVIEYNKINEYFENAKNKRNPTTAST